MVFGEREGRLRRHHQPGLVGCFGWEAVADAKLVFVFRGSVENMDIRVCLHHIGQAEAWGLTARSVGGELICPEPEGKVELGAG